MDGGLGSAHRHRPDKQLQEAFDTRRDAGWCKTLIEVCATAVIAAGSGLAWIVARRRVPAWHRTVGSSGAVCTLDGCRPVVLAGFSARWRPAIV
jgi:hypothetical protein